MTTEKALEILNSNYSGLSGSMTYYLYEESLFSKKAFWELYDSIIILADRKNTKNIREDIIMKITQSYRNILKVFVYHFDKHDSCRIEGFPDNYYEYIERLDDAVNSLFTGVLVDDSIYSLQRDD
jgi:hypothetical protein